MEISFAVRFWMYLAFVIPSILCAMFCLYELLFTRALRKALNNHVMIAIVFLVLMYNVTTIVWFIDFYRTGRTMFFTPAFCLIWGYSDFAFFSSILFAVAWASIERHILIFYQNLFATRMKRVFFHYAPLCISTLYPFIYYMFIFFVHPCNVIHSPTVYECGSYFCAFTDPVMHYWDTFANNIAPVFSIVIFSVALLGRVWYSKYRANQPMRWRNYRKMTIQLLSVSSLYVILMFPPMFIHTVYVAGVPPTFAEGFYTITTYTCYFVFFLTPFGTMFSLPELRSRLSNIFRTCRLRTHTILPATTVVRTGQ